MQDVILHRYYFDMAQLEQDFMSFQRKLCVRPYVDVLESNGITVHLRKRNDGPQWVYKVAIVQAAPHGGNRTHIIKAQQQSKCGMGKITPSSAVCRTCTDTNESNSHCQTVSTPVGTDQRPDQPISDRKSSHATRSVEV